MGIFVKDTHFELINELIKPDAKKRLSLGSAAAQAGVTYNIYRNQIGQIMLDPVKTVKWTLSVGQWNRESKLCWVFSV
jgi:hypothetical protein